MFRVKRFTESKDEENILSKIIDKTKKSLETAKKSLEKTEVDDFSIDLQEYIKLCELFLFSLENETSNKDNIASLVFEMSSYITSRSSEFKHEDTTNASRELSQIAEEII